MTYLTKSDFRVAQTCPTKLYYRQLGYPTTNDSNEFMAILAEQGYLVEALTRLGYPSGRRLDLAGTVEQQAQATADALLNSEDITLFEATVISDGKLARIDILDKQGDTLRLIEIKSSAYDSSSDNGQANAAFWTKRGTPKIQTRWRGHLEDITFQWLVLSECFPEATIVPYLVLLDSTQPTTENHIQKLLNQSGAKTDPAEFANGSLVLELDVSREVEALLGEVQTAVKLYLTGLGPHPTRLGPNLSTNCRSCEYQVSSLEQNGFRECWGPMADTSPHILELFSVSTVGGTNSGLVDELIRSGKASLYDIPTESLVKADGTVGIQAERQLRQIQQTRLHEEWVDPELGQILNNAQYPLHFIDFETCTPTIPRYAGMRPFELIAFQWSCHTIASPGAEAVHSEWLQSHDNLPNVDFAHSLRARLEDEGTILVWSSHEQTVLKTIRQQLVDHNLPDAELSAWLRKATADMPNGRVLDMYKLVTRHYYHPRMGGKTSIKSVCEAIWNEDDELRGRYPEFVIKADQVQSPYRSLPPIPIDGEETTVRNGTGAILAYMKMMGDDGVVTAEDQQRWRQLLTQYCRLDTLAMVMIWEHWQKASEAITN